MQAGIVSYGLEFPAEFETAEAVADKAGIPAEAVRALGIEKKPRPGPEDQPVAMASRAAARALEKAGGISAQDVDVVIYTGEEYKDYIAQTAAIRLQEEVGCRRAYAFDLVGQGVSLLVGLRIARGMMAGDREVDTVLLAGGTRNVDLVDPTRPDTRFLLPYSASGGAMILKRGHGENTLEGTAVVVDPEMADDIFVPGGGTAIPFAADNLGSDIMFYQARDRERLSAYLEREWPKKLAAAARQAAGGYPIDYLALRHASPADRRRVLASLGLSPDQSAALYDWGHHGPNDVIISLDLGIKSGAVRPGSRVLMVSGGTGFTYAAAAVLRG